MLGKLEKGGESRKKSKPEKAGKKRLSAFYLFDFTEIKSREKFKPEILIFPSFNSLFLLTNQSRKKSTPKGGRKGFPALPFLRLSPFRGDAIFPGYSI